MAGIAVILWPLFSYADTSNISVTVFTAQCTDGIDNDGDSLIDNGSDPGCSSNGDDDETDAVLAACQDGTDNDGDGLTDYPSDPGCDSAADSSEVNISSSGGGGGNWTNIIAPTAPALSTVSFAGFASPGAFVMLSASGRAMASTTASLDGGFTITTQITPGTYVFGITSRDDAGRYGAFRSIPMTVSRDSRSAVSGIAISPTLSVQVNEKALFSGKTVPAAIVRLAAGSIERSVLSDATGSFSFEVDPVLLTGTISARVYAEAGSMTVPWSNPVQLRIDTAVRSAPLRKADINADGRVDLADFSMLLYWYRRELSPSLVEIERARFNADGKLDFTDFSIMAYHWTG